MIASESKFIAAWQIAASKAKKSGVFNLPFDLNTVFSFESVTRLDAITVRVVGVFLRKNGFYLAVSFDFDASRTCVTNIRSEIKKNFVDLVLVPKEHRIRSASAV